MIAAPATSLRMPQQQLQSGGAAERDAGVEDAIGAEVRDPLGDGIGQVGDRERLAGRGGGAVARQVPRDDPVALCEQRHDLLPQDRRRAERRAEDDERGAVRGRPER